MDMLDAFSSCFLSAYHNITEDVICDDIPRQNEVIESEPYDNIIRVRTAKGSLYILFCKTGKSKGRIIEYIGLVPINVFYPHIKNIHDFVVSGKDIFVINNDSLVLFDPYTNTRKILYITSSEEKEVLVNIEVDTNGDVILLSHYPNRNAMTLYNVIAFRATGEEKYRFMPGVGSNLI
jgi:hypothetical protein